MVGHEDLEEYDGKRYRQQPHEIGQGDQHRGGGSHGAQVRAWDPVADGSGLTGVEIAATPEAALAGADAVVVVTEWPQIGEIDWPAAALSMQKAVLIDGRNMLDPEALRAAGFVYEGIGRAAAQASS